MTAPTKRRRFRFSLRTLLIVVVLLSVPLGWFALKMRQAEKQRKTVEAIREAGGVVWYEDGYGNQLPNPSTPAWLRRMTGEDFCSDVVTVSDYNSSAGDVILEHVKGLTKLKSVELSGSEVTDTRLESLKEVTHLKYLQLSGSGVTDSGLKHVVKGLAKLASLGLSRTEITDAGVEGLTSLARLEWLDLSHTKVTDSGLERLTGLTRLRIWIFPVHESGMLDWRISMG